MQILSLSLHSTPALMLESEWKQAARRTLKAMQGTEFFTLQMGYQHQVCGGAPVWHNSTAVLYIQLLSVQMYSTVIPDHTEQGTDLKPWDDIKIDRVSTFCRLHDLTESEVCICESLACFRLLLVCADCKQLKKTVSLLSTAGTIRWHNWQPPLQKYINMHKAWIQERTSCSCKTSS